MKLVDLFSSSKIYHFKKAQVIIRPDEEIPYVYYIIKGFVNIYSISPAGEQKVLLIYMPGQVFPLLSTLRGDKESLWFFEAMTDVDLFRVMKNEIHDQIKNDSNIKDEVMTLLIDIIKIFRRRIDILEIIKSSERIIEDLLFLSESFGIINEDGSVTLNVPITHKDIASRAGIARETASREISKLEKKGYVSYSGHLIVIKNINKLREELELLESD